MNQKEIAKEKDVNDENLNNGKDSIKSNDDEEMINLYTIEINNDLNKESFEAYGISKGKIDDPNKKSILALFNELHLLNEKISSLESKISKTSSKKNDFNLKLKKIKTTKKGEGL